MSSARASPAWSAAKPRFRRNMDAARRVPLYLPTYWAEPWGMSRLSCCSVRTVADDATIESAQASLDRLCVKLDGRRRRRDGQATTVGALADAEPLRPLPTGSYPAEVAEHRKVTAQGLVAWRGNQYSVPPGLVGATVTVTHRLGSETVALATDSGAIIAAHHRAVDGSGAVVRDAGHVVALEQAVLAGFSTTKPCTHKTRRPPSVAAVREAARLRGVPGKRSRSESGDRSGRVCRDRSTTSRCSPS